MKLLFKASLILGLMATTAWAQTLQVVWPDGLVTTVDRSPSTTLVPAHRGAQVLGTPVVAVAAKYAQSSVAVPVVHSTPVYAAPVVVEKTVVVEKPVIVQKTVVVEKPVIVEKEVIVEKPVYVDRPVVLEVPYRRGRFRRGYYGRNHYSGYYDDCYECYRNRW